MLVNETPIILENLFRMLSESSFIESSIFLFRVRVFYCRVRISQTRVRARVRVFPESGFSSGPSPVRVSKYALYDRCLKMRAKMLINLFCRKYAKCFEFSPFRVHAELAKYCFFIVKCII